MRKVSTILAVGLLGSLLVGLAQGPAIAAGTFGQGDVFVSVSAGQVQWHLPDGSLVQTLDDTTGSFTTGMAFDAAGNLYVTDFGAGSVSVFDNTGALQGTFGSGFSTPESILFDGAGNAYVGDASASVIQKFDATGNPLDSFDVAVEDRGTDWIDLAADQCTMLYTSEGTTVFSYDVCADAQNPDFATGLPGGAAYALRILPDDSILVADTQTIVRLDSSGTPIQSYDATINDVDLDSWFAINLDPDGTSFWSGDFSTADVVKFDIATGAVLPESFNTGTGSDTVFGVAVKGEITAARHDLTVSKIGTGTGTVTSDLPGINCGVTCSASYAPTDTVTLTATADPGSTFVEWSGDCSGTTCVVTMDQARSVTARFDLAARHDLTVSKIGTGTGTVTSDLPGINCGVTCAASYAPTDTVTLTATADPGSTFVEWSGDCSGTTCVVTMDQARSVTARFDLVESDTTPPTCSLVKNKRLATFTIQDVGSGLASISVQQSVGASVSIPSFAVGTTDPVVVTATHVAGERQFKVVLEIRDVAGNVTVCGGKKRG